MWWDRASACEWDFEEGDGDTSRIANMEQAGDERATTLRDAFVEDIVAGGYFRP